jgi:RNA polymerase sigma-70 factor (ECF subfamily)
LKASFEPWPARLIVQEEVKAPMVRGGAAPESSLPEALAQIYERHFDFVWRNARRLGVHEANADDVAQDVFMIVQRRIAHYDGRASMQAWIFGILIRVVRDHRRSFRRKGARHVPLEQATQGATNAIEPGPTPVEVAERAEQVRVLERLLAALDEDKRTLLILSELEQWTLREIADLFDSNTNTIHSRLRAAKKAFQEVYARSQAGKEALP